MPLEKISYQPEDAFLSQPVTARAYIKAGQNFVRFTPLMKDADTALLVVWDGTPGTAVAMSARASGAPVSDEKSAVYVGGGFRISAITWPASIDSEAKKCAAFLGSAIYVDDEA